ncbi:Hypothetical protein CINCED_3A013108 [Cinara cedri]|uniref:Uncharacterized protein n=1 Tax=Cinara cedri TaxID=506608 RepID=A0A5E4M530_9HEMI|nr:Hypothetical protein CINCED_3A013108 [Cinara cedri]
MKKNCKKVTFENKILDDNILTSEGSTSSSDDSTSNSDESTSNSDESTSSSNESTSSSEESTSSSEKSTSSSEEITYGSEELTSGQRTSTILISKEPTTCRDSTDKIVKKKDLVDPSDIEEEMFKNDREMKAYVDNAYFLEFHNYKNVFEDNYPDVCKLDLQFKNNIGSIDFPRSKEDTNISACIMEDCDIIVTLGNGNINDYTSKKKKSTFMFNKSTSRSHNAYTLKKLKSNRHFTDIIGKKKDKDVPSYIEKEMYINNRGNSKCIEIARFLETENSQDAFCDNHTEIWNADVQIENHIENPYYPKRKKEGKELYKKRSVLYQKPGVRIRELGVRSRDLGVGIKAQVLSNLYSTIISTTYYLDHGFIQNFVSFPINSTGLGGVGRHWSSHNPSRPQFHRTSNVLDSTRALISTPDSRSRPLTLKSRLPTYDSRPKTTVYILLTGLGDLGV